jgi:hypothetical protein
MTHLRRLSPAFPGSCKIRVDGKGIKYIVKLQWLGLLFAKKLADGDRLANPTLWTSDID